MHPPLPVTISDVHYINVSGSASGKVANNTVATLECSASCTNITAMGTHLTPKNATATPVYLCANLANEALLDFKCTDVPITKG
jgi:galacturan 1,4-alpha-galacturonidase